MAPLQRMTYAEAVARIPARDLPDFWVGSVDTLTARLDGVREGDVGVIAHSPGRRGVYLVAYG